MEGKILSIEDAQKLANYEKLYQQNIEYKSNNRLLKEMLNMIMDNICFYIDVEAEEIECEEND